MPSGDSLSEIATRHQVFLERLKTQKARQFSESIDLLAGAIQETVGELEVSNLGELNARQLKSFLGKLRKKQDKILTKSVDEFVKSLKEISEYESGFEVRSLDSELKEVYSRKIKLPKAEAVYLGALKSPLSATGELLEPFVKKWQRSTILKVENSARRAWVEGRTTSQFVREIRGTKANKFKDGLVQGVSRRQAEAVARTSVQHMASESRMAVWKANKSLGQKYRYVATLDSRTTAVCRSLDGKVFELGKGPRPPVHIGCRSTTILELEDEFQFLNEDATRASKVGPVSSNETYYSWLKKQSASFQNDAIGKTRAKLLRDGGLSAEKFSALQLDRNFQPMTLKEMRAAEPSIFEKAGL